MQKGEPLKDGSIVAGDIDEEVVVVEGLEFDLCIGGLHDLIDFAVLLAADELSVFICELDLEADLVVEGLLIQVDERRDVIYMSKQWR